MRATAYSAPCSAVWLFSPCPYTGVRPRGRRDATGTRSLPRRCSRPARRRPRARARGCLTAHLAMVHAAVYDAVNAIVGCHEPYVSSPAAQALVLAGRRRRGRRASCARQRRPRDPAAECPDRGRLSGDGAAIPDGRRRPAGSPRRSRRDRVCFARAGDGRFGPFASRSRPRSGRWRLVPPATVTDPGASARTSHRSCFASASLPRPRTPRA